MIPSKLDLLVWRGTSFETELVSQVKKFTYDPALHNSPADLRRSHAENLEHYGFVWEYVDFATLYATASLVVRKPWGQQGAEEREILLSLDTGVNGGIELTDHSVKIGIPATLTQQLAFDKGSYKLLLTTANNKVDGLIYGTMHVKGEK